MSQIKNFTDLNTWKEGHKLVLLIYKFTESFPKYEIYGLTNQIRRSAVSITSNIAEGFARKTTKDKCHFYSISEGFLKELQNQLLIAKDIKYLEDKNYVVVISQLEIVGRLLFGLKKICL